jgi:glutamate dehydrogenase (NADP+)
MIQYASGGKESFEGKRVAISGSGNVAQYAALKCIELKAKVISLSDSKGALIAKDADKGFTEEDVALIAKLKLDRQYLNQLYDAEDSFQSRFTYIPGARPWSNVGKVDVALPSATQNEVSEQEAKDLIAAGCKFIAEGSNMGSTQEAIDVYEADRAARKGDGIWYGPAKAANCGGVAVSGLEMAQNSQRVSWTSEQVDQELAGIMERCFWDCLNTAKEYFDVAEGELPSLVNGANVSGYIKVARAMHDHGDWWANSKQ